jgi:ribosomal protein S18 acetylase RimI-like enzyme
LQAVSIVAADTLPAAVLADLFTRAYSDYFVPLSFDEGALRDHVRRFDIDLRCSRVVVAAGRPVAFALIARRGGAGWVGGMGTAPDCRRRGLGELALTAGLDAAVTAGCREIWLEVIDANRAAQGLYGKLGFKLVRDLVVWSLPAAPRRHPTCRVVQPGPARAWIVAHRCRREPWQRSDQTLDNLEQAGESLGALVHERHAGEISAAVVFREVRDTVSVLQVAAHDQSSAAEVLIAAASGPGNLRLSNVPGDDPASQTLAGLGANVVARQHEMRLSVV